MNFDTSFITDAGDEIVDLMVDPAHPQDSMALLPFVGAPFGYNAYRQGRGSWGATALGVGIGVGFTEAAFLYAGTRAGFTATELMLGRAMGAAGITYGGRIFGFGSLLKPKHAKGFGWRIPTWAIALGMYEYGQWFSEKVASAQPGSQAWHDKHGTKFSRN